MGIRDNLRRAASALIDFVDPILKADDHPEVGIEADNHPSAQPPPPPPVEKAEDDPKAMFWDPFALVEAVGYKERPSAITYQTLSTMVWRMPILQAIIQTRVNQVASFAQPQRDRFMTGFRIKLRDSEARPQGADKKFAKQMEEIFMRTGVTENQRGRDGFAGFLRKAVWDSMVFDQMTFEVVPNRKGQPAEWYAVDATTVRLADTPKLFYDEDEEDEIRTVQIYDNMVIAEFTAKEMAFCVRNPRTSIRNHGYGTPELETLIKAITSILFAWDYNSRFFCAAPGTLVTTTKGLIPIEQLADKHFQIWNGRAWKEARGYRTGVRPLVRTKLWNGLEIETSPEHRFRVLRDGSMHPEWVRQKDLKHGDTALIDAGRSDPAFDAASLFVGKTYETDRSTGRAFTIREEMVKDPNFWEMVGFMLGDGYWPSPGDRSGVLAIFPHHTKDLPLFERFLGIAERYGIHAKQVTIRKTLERRDGEFGCPAIHVHQRAFLEWLHETGFTCSTSGKRIPAILFRQPAFMRDALLRGLFSADGCTHTHPTGYRTPSVHSENRVLRQDILRCLLSVGVAAQEVGSGWERSGELHVQDVAAFVKYIGYLQEYKNESIDRSKRSRHRWDKLRASFSVEVAKSLVAHPERTTIFSDQENDYIRKAARGLFVMSRPRASELLRKAGFEPGEALFYRHVPIDVFDATPASEVEMFDVEVFDDEHIFLANGIATHNTQGSTQKGILNFKGAIPAKQLQAFRRQWYQMVSGVENAFRTPVVNSEDVQWISMHTSNRDMEYNAWMDFLIKVICAVFQMDPIEVNFKYGNTGSQRTMFEAANKQKLTESKDRGLKPLLRFVADALNKYILWPINENFEFVFMGLDAQTPEELAKLNEMRVKTIYMVDELRAENDLPPLPDGQGQVILDPTWMQFRQAMMTQGQQLQQGGGAEGSPGFPGLPAPGGQGQPQPGPGGAQPPNGQNNDLMSLFNVDEEKQQPPMQKADVFFDITI